MDWKQTVSDMQTKPNAPKNQIIIFELRELKDFVAEEWYVWYTCDIVCFARNGLSATEHAAATLKPILRVQDIF